MLNKSVSIENNFTKGLITEATGLNFPENACTETYNCVFDRIGEVSRRYGIDLEDHLEALADYDADKDAITEFFWTAVALTGDINFLTIQIGSVISFWKIDTDGLIAPNYRALQLI
jgi:hypothetical protein